MTKPTHFTTAAVAVAIERAERTVRDMAARHRIGAYHGRQLWFTSADVAKLRSLRHDGPGRPKSTG